MEIRIHQCKSRKTFPANLVSKLIEKVQGTNFCHYAMSYRIGGGEFTFCDSSASGVKRTSEAAFRKKYQIVKSYCGGKTINYDEFFPWLNKHLGKGYGFKQIAGLFLKGVGIVRKNPFGKGSKRIICNELVILFLNRFYGTMIKDTDSLDLNDTTKLLNKLWQ